MKMEGELKVTFTNDGNIDNIAFPRNVESFPEKQVWNDHILWETKGRDNRMNPVSQKAIQNLDRVCKEFADHGFIGCKKSGKRKLTSIKYVLQTSLGGYEFVKEK